MALFACTMVLELGVIVSCTCPPSELHRDPGVSALSKALQEHTIARTGVSTLLDTYKVFLPLELKLKLSGEALTPELRRCASVVLRCGSATFRDLDAWSST
jgi:hypothetical protein